MNRRAAGFVHAAMVAGVVMIVVVFAIVRTLAPPEPLLELVWILRFIAAANLVGVMVLARMFRAQATPRSRGDDGDAWWRTNGLQLFVVWALAEGAALVGAVFWFLTGDMPILIGVSAVSLVILVANRPAAY
jgi:hypothetical protein